MGNSSQNSGEIPVQQVGVVPLRFVGPRLEVCLITSRRAGRWGIPKGHISHYPSIRDAALAEAQEEAGLRGIIFEQPLGQFLYRKEERDHRVLVYLMDVQAVDKRWKEFHLRTRRWLSINEAKRMVGWTDLVPMFDIAAARFARVPTPLFPGVRDDLPIADNVTTY